MMLDMGDLLFQRSLLFNGRAVDIQGCLYCERSAEGMIGVSDGKAGLGPGFKTVSPGFAENLLCGVGARDGTTLGLGVVRKINFRQRRIALISPVPAGAIKTVQFGDMYVSPEGRELGRKRPGGF
jgi:polynucleotide 5'-kinase involved in rRNA processing